MLSQGPSHTGRTRGSDWPASARYLPTRSYQIHKAPPGPSRPHQAPPGPSRPHQAPPGPSRPLQATPGPSRPHQAPPGPSRPLQAPPGHSRPLQAPPGPTRPLQAPPGPTRPLQAPPGPTRPLQATAGPSRPLQAPPGPTRPHQAPPGPSRPHQAPPGPSRPHQVLPDATRSRKSPGCSPQQSSSEASDKAHPWPHTGRSWRACACEGHSLHLSGRRLSQSSSVWSCRVSHSRVCVALATSRTQNLSRRYQSKSRTVLLASHPRLIPVLPAPQVDIQALLDQGVGIAPHEPGDHAGCAGQTSPSSLLICKVEATGPGHCLPEDKEIVTKISAPSPPMLNRNRETEFGRNRVALLLFPEEEHGRLAPQELCPLPGDHKEPSRWNS